MEWPVIIVVMARGGKFTNKTNGAQGIFAGSTRFTLSEQTHVYAPKFVFPSALGKWERNNYFWVEVLDSIMSLMKFDHKYVSA